MPVSSCTRALPTEIKNQNQVKPSAPQSRIGVSSPQIVFTKPGSPLQAVAQEAGTGKHEDPLQFFNDIRAYRESKDLSIPTGDIVLLCKLGVTPKKYQIWQGLGVTEAKEIALLCLWDVTPEKYKLWQGLGDKTVEEIVSLCKLGVTPETYKAGESADVATPPQSGVYESKV